MKRYDAVDEGDGWASVHVRIPGGMLGAPVATCSFRRKPLGGGERRRWTPTRWASLTEKDVVRRSPPDTTPEAMARLMDAAAQDAL